MPTFVAHAPGEGPEQQGSATQARAATLGAYYRDKFFGTLASVDKTVEASGHQFVVTLRLLEVDEQRRCAAFAYERSEGRIDSDEYLLAQTVARIAFMLVAVNGAQVAKECPSLEQRVQLAASLWDTLQDAIIDAYNALRDEPIALLSEMAADPDFGDTPAATGSSSAGEASPQEG